MQKIQTAQVSIPLLLDTLATYDLVLVTYKTKIGATRVMGCTTRLEAIPEEKHSERHEKRLNGEAVVCVYDFQNKNWRSFRKDSVVSWVVV